MRYVDLDEWELRDSDRLLFFFDFLEDFTSGLLLERFLQETT